MTTVLGVETSCDETAVAVVEDGRFIRSNVVFTQEQLHRRFGGVVPELASRQHVLGIVPAIEQALSAAGVTLQALDAIAVTHGPGLAGSLLVGVNTAKAIALVRDLPLVAVNHLEGHVYANWLVKPDRGRVGGTPTAAVGAAVAMSNATPAARRARRTPGTPRFPLLCLIVSGGHSELVLMEGHGSYRPLGRTRDDAAGEAFDKVARILGLGYPGGPAIQRAAAQAGDAPIPAAFRLTRPWLRGTYDFSFSGIKTAMLRLVEGGASGASKPVDNPSPLAKFAPVSAAEVNVSADGTVPQPIAQLAASFQQTVVDVLVGKTIQAADDFDVRQIAIAGGVAANAHLRAELGAKAQRPVLIPDIDLCTDNAAMIAGAGFFRLQAGAVAGADLEVYPNLRLA